MNTPLTQRTSSHHVHAKTVGRVRVRSLAARGLAVVLIALAARLALPLQAQAQTDPTPTVTISADKTSAVFKEDDITYTLTRTGSTTAALPVTVRLMQTEDFLAATELTNKTVTINAGQSTATFTVAASSFQHFAAGTKVGGGTLEAAVQDGANYDLGMTSSVEVNFFIGVMIRFEMERYSVGEAAGPVKVTVFARSGRHAGQPTSGVPYDIRPGGGSATNSSDFFFVNLHPEFLSSNFESVSGGVWQAEHTYDVTITDDEVNEVDETFDVQIARSDSQTYSLVDAAGKSCGSVCTATVTIIDDDTATATPGVTVSTTALTVTEEDPTGGSYTVVLDSQPTADVMVTVDGHAGTEVTPTPATLTFTTVNWEMAQTVTVTAGIDANTANETVSLTHSATSTDTDYEGITIAGVAVTVNDNDTASVTVSTTALTVTEEDPTGGSYTVVLDSQPAADVMVTVDGHAGTEVTPTPATLTFTTLNWETAQTVAVTAGTDANTANETVSLTHSATSTDTDYEGITIAGVAVTVNDNDTASVTVSTTALTVTEEDPTGGSYTVVLDSQPAADVMVTVDGHAGTEVTPTPATLTFTTLNWETAQTVAVTAGTDANTANETVSLTHSATSTDTDYEGITIAGVAVTVNDDDTASVTVSTTALTVTEEDPTGGSYTVVLDSQPAADVMVTVDGHAGTEVTPIPGTLTFTTVNWETAQTVTVTAGTDANTANETVSLTHSATSTDTDYEGITIAGVAVTVNDDDTATAGVAPAVAVEGETLRFVVTLSAADAANTTLGYLVTGVTATAGTDYTAPAAGAALTIPAGQTTGTITIETLADLVAEDSETLTLTLINPVNATLDPAKSTAEGTILDAHDPLPRALMGRFGRTAAGHVVEHVEARMAAAREVGAEAHVAGREVRPGMERELALDFLSQLGASAGLHAPGAGAGRNRSGSPMGAAAGSMGLAAGTDRTAGGAMGLAAGPMDGMAGPDGGLFDRGLRSMGLGGGNLRTGSSFAVTRETRHGGLLSFWGRAALSSFVGREGALGLDGNVATAMAGVDYAKGPTVVGLSLAHSRGRGGYHGLSSVSSGRVASSVTGLYPWLGYELSDRVSVWGVTGYGTGALTLTPGEAAARTSGLSMAMAAGGLRGDLADSVVAGFGLAFKADALWVGTAIDGVTGPGGNLAATEAAATRFRTGLEASRGYRFERGLSLTPSVEVGLRHDAGDAETGAGMDVGAGLIASDTSAGLAVDVRVRMLLVHQAEGFRERGGSVSLSYNPTPSTPLGFVATVTPSWGGQATSGAEALWGRETMGGLAHGGLAQGNRIDAEAGYGLPVGSRLVGTPRLGFTTSEHGRDYRVGYGLGVLDREHLHLELGVDAHRRESPMLGAVDTGVLGRASLGW